MKKTATTILTTSIKSSYAHKQLETNKQTNKSNYFWKSPHADYYPTNTNTNLWLELKQFLWLGWRIFGMVYWYKYCYGFLEAIYTYIYISDIYHP